MSRTSLTARLGEPSPAPRLGDALVAAGLATRAQVETIAREATRTGALLGELAVARGVVRRLDLVRVLSDAWGVPFVDLVRTPPDRELIASLGLPPDRLAGLRWTPVGAAHGLLLVATAERPTARLEDEVRESTGWSGRIAFHATTELDLRVALLRGAGPDLARVAASRLATTSPLESASRVLVPWQVAALAACACLALAAAVAAPGATAAAALVACNLVLAGNVGFKALAIACGLARSRRPRTRASSVDDRDLPRYTVLVPAFGEANVIGELIAHLGALDYPADRLEVLLLLEECDRETIDAARAARMPASVRIVVVPDGQPRTKPKACNVGLGFAHGELLVIYDAEDRPEPDQLRKAVAAFRAAPPEVVCLQARLNYHNADENLLTRFFTLEYSHWFDLMLEGLSALRLPLPLGGTSNHFRTAALRELGGWDPHNVTEDADLGLRAAARGLRVATLDSTTYEEACCRTWPWIRQRTRWIKGYMQTALVHTRQPASFVRHAGLRASLTLLLLVAGTPLAFLAAPVLWAVMLVGLARGRGPGLAAGSVEQDVAVANLVVGNSLLVLVSAVAALRRGRPALAAVSLLLPLYWVLHSVAAYRALGQLVTRPSHWEKTPHGLSRHVTPSPAAARALAADVAATARRAA